MSTRQLILRRFSPNPNSLHGIWQIAGTDVKVITDKKLLIYLILFLQNGKFISGAGLLRLTEKLLCACIAV